VVRRRRATVERKEAVGVRVISRSTVVIACTSLKQWKMVWKKNFRKIYRIPGVTLYFENGPRKRPDIYICVKFR
jgi:hypothetical protein